MAAREQPRVAAAASGQRALGPLQWAHSLSERDFVGTESRLNTIFDLLRQLLAGVDVAPVDDLQGRRAGMPLACSS
jgi:hypothetical protein